MTNPSNLLLPSDEESSDANEEKDFHINKKYASEYQKRKQKQELALYKDDESESDDDSSEDEDGNLLTTDLDVNIMKTLNAIRNKEKQVYDPETKFFGNQTENESTSDDEEEVKAKPKRYKDVLREEILEKMEKQEADNDQEESSFQGDEDDDQKFRFAYDDEQKEIRKAFLDSTKDDSDDEGLLVIKSKGHRDIDPEIEKELQQEIAKLEATVGEKSKLVDPRGEVKNGESFLLNYFKNRAWLDTERDDESSSEEGDDSDGEVPMKTSPSNRENDDASLEELDQADDFEAKYNFRFEEAASQHQSGAELSNISYARGQTMTTLRRKDETRREKRLARQERKALERQAKEEQLRRLKNAKRQELEEKMKQIKSVLGDLDDGAVDEAMLLQLLEGDFDPDKFESLMKDTYGDEFYQKQDSQWKNDLDVRESLKSAEDGALLVGQDDVEGGLYDGDGEDDENENENSHDNDEDEWPDDMEEEPYNEEAGEETELERKVKSRMMDELYKLDYEDIIADMPTRFKYKQVNPNNYGLTTEEILFCRDSTLKQFVSLKKLAPYQEEGEYVVNSRKRRRFREIARKEMEELMQQDRGLDEEYAEKNHDEEKDQKKKRRRKRSKKGEDETKEESKDEPPKGTKDRNPEASKSKRRRRKKNAAATEMEDKDSKAKEEHEPRNTKKEIVKEMKTETAEIKSDKKEKKGVSSDNKESKKTSSDKKAKMEESSDKKESKKASDKKDKKKRPSKSKSKKKVKEIDGVSQSRLASYGL